jgi:hypothetical protein
MGRLIRNNGRLIWNNVPINYEIVPIIYDQITQSQLEEDISLPIITNI